MKQTFTLLILFLSLQSVTAQRFDWATSGGAAGIANSFGGALDIARDPQGNIYIVDYGNHAQQCQGDTLQKITGTTAYIYKFNAQGVLQFMNRVGALGGSFTPFSIETDDAGSLYLLGQPSGNGFIIVNEDTVPSVDFTNQLIKMDSNGNFVWKQNTGVPTNYEGCMLQYSHGYLYYQSGILSVSQIDTAGVLGSNLTASYYTSPTSSPGLLFKGSGVFSNGDLLFAAYSRGTVAYGTDTLFHIGNPFLTAPVLFVRCDTSMNPVWARYASNARDPDNNFIPLAIDSSDNMYAAVQVNVEMIIGNDTILTAGFTGQGAIIKLDSSGNGIWAHALQSSQLAYAWCMHKAPDNSGIVLGGGYTGTAQFGSFTLAAGSLSKPFIAKFDHNGNYTHAFNYLQNPTQTDALSMAADNNGNYYVGGKLADATIPVFSCTPIAANKGFYLGSFTEQPDSVPTPVINVNGNTLTATPPFSGKIQWYINGSIMEGDTLQSLTVTESGNYSVVYTYLTGCVGADTSQVQTIIGAAVNSNTAISSVSLYPNPNHGEFSLMINTSKGGDYELTILDIFGRKQFSGKQHINIGNTVIPLSLETAGMYFVTLSNAQERIVKRVMVSR